VFIFFFSSRRRHTRFSRDWSSDVCSSDLDDFAHGEIAPPRSVRSLSCTTRSGSMCCSTPSPPHAGQAPNGLLNENSRGSISGIRSEERRVGKECRSRWSEQDEKTKRRRTS